jgi:CBS domain containing-hemolysin-like protein
MSGGHGLGTDSLPLAMGAVGFCVVMVAAFASSEASILAANKIRIQQLAEKGDKRAKAFCELRENEDKMFATILAVENMFIIFGSSFGVSSAENILGPNAIIPLGFATIGALALVPFLLEFVIVLFGEITPKTYAARHATRMALLVSRPLNLIVNLLYPLIKYTFVIPSRLLIRGLDRIFGSKEYSPSITEEELRMIIDRSSQEGVLDSEERDLIHNVFEFGDTVASEVMTNRTRIVAFEGESKVWDALPKMIEEGYSQYPVYGDSIDDIRGMIYLKDLFRAQVNGQYREGDTLEKYMRPTVFVPETKNVVQLLEMMQKNRTRAIIVADEFGGTEGLVTLDDLVTEIVGEFDDDQVPVEDFIQPLGNDSFQIQGATPLSEVNETLDLDLPEGQYQTIAGFVLAQLGHIPDQGASVKYQEIEIEVTQVMGPKILCLELRKLNGSLESREGSGLPEPA